jgi:hypothetical protein
MKGDFSRIRFNPGKLYSAVLKQQGRVDLDSDANEQSFIDGYLRDVTNQDVIGQYGGPIGHAGFAIKIENNEIHIGPGRYYVDGILVENKHWVHYDKQPYLDSPNYTASQLLEPVLRDEGTIAQFTLEVWQRMVTGLDDNCLLEPALGQADTTTRLQTVWRVIGSLTNTSDIPAPEPADPANPISELAPCCQMLYNAQSKLPRDGAMKADTNQTGNDCNCQPIAAAGYQGLENQLYRVEIHTSGNLNTATFKWSRENASVVTQITNVSGAVVTVSSLGPDANLGYQAGQWVELSDDTYLFSQPANQPGQLYQILSVNQATLQVTMTNPVYGVNTSMNARMRRWDQFGASATAQGLALANTPIQLENGIEVTFRAGNYQSGDYWTIPARTADGQIDWPPCGGNGNLFQPASYMQIYEAPLACVQPRPYNAYIYKTGQYENDRYLISDCRLLFSPLTALANDAGAAALHITNITWTNDDIMTVDQFMENGFSVTFDNTTTCPWGGGNWEVRIEPPFLFGEAVAALEGINGIPKPTFTSPPGTDCFLRTVMALDPPWGIIVTGNQVSWLQPTTFSAGSENYSPFIPWTYLNYLCGGATPIGLTRVRVRLIGGAIYGNGASGNMYLDGQSFGTTGSRILDSSEDVNYIVPSGGNQAASDYEGWFYLAPTPVIQSVVIQGVENNQETTVTAIKILIDGNNNVIGIQTGETQSFPITGLRALITMNYPPISNTPISLQFSGVGAGNVVSIAPNVTVSAGSATLAVPINILTNPGPGTNTLTLIASVVTAVGPIGYSPAPTLNVTGSTAPTNPTIPLPNLPIQFKEKE